MSLHTADLTRRISGHLARRTPPKAFASDENSKAAQITDYVSILCRFAPEGERLTSWWRHFEDRLSDQSDTWAWPTPNEVTKAAKAASAACGTSSSSWKPDPVQINLGRLNRNEPIGEDWLWGAGARRLEAAGANRHLMRDRRVKFAEDMAAIYPVDKVHARLEELRVRHEKASLPAGDRLAGSHAVEISKKQAFSAAELAALVD